MNTPPALSFDAPDPVIDHVPYTKYGEIAYEVAVLGAPSNDDVDAILDKFEISRATFLSLLGRPAFKRAVSEARLFINKNADSNSFKVKARFYAEQMITKVYDKLSRDDADAGQQLKALEAIVRYADLDPTGGKKEAGSSSASVILNIGAGVRGISQAAPDSLTVEVKDVD